MSEAEKKTIVIVLRSLVNSQKNASLDDLGRDFAQTEGGRIPFQKFGFSNLADFLTASGEFSVTPYGMVQVKQSANSAHINKLVAEQNTTSKKKKPKSYFQPQRNLNPTTVRFNQYQPSGFRKPFVTAQSASVYKWTASNYPKPTPPPPQPAGNQQQPFRPKGPWLGFQSYNAKYNKQP